MINKKAQIFTFIAVIMVVVIGVLFSIETSPPSRERSNVISNRLSIADDYIKNLEYVYIQRALYTSSYRSLEALALYINQSGFSDLDDEKEMNSIFKEILLNGTVKKASVDGIIKRNLIAGVTFMDRLKDVENASRDFLRLKTNFTTDTSRINVSIYQDNTTGPFRVKVNITYSYFVDAELATWNRSVSTVLDFSIVGIDDPAYMEYGQSNLSHPITISNLTAWDRRTVKSFILNGMYRYENKSSSFLMRFYNAKGPSECCGMQSIVPPALADAVGNRERSYVDCDFISEFCVPVPGYEKYYNITGITNSTYHLRLDEYSMVRYNLSEYRVYIP